MNLAPRTCAPRSARRYWSTLRVPMLSCLGCTGVLAPYGPICLTAPFVWPLHEEPFDFDRYTNHSLELMLERAGFVDVVVEPRAVTCSRYVRWRR